MLALGVALLAFIGWQVARFSAKNRLPTSAVQRDIAHPEPIEVPLAGLPLFRSESPPTNAPSIAAQPAPQRVGSNQFQSAGPPVTGNQSTALSAWITGLTTDSRGSLWIATEDQGVWKYRADATTSEPGTVFTVADGLGDNNIYAIACDGLGRIWVGHLNHGVSVYNGARWQNYDVLTGPLGERVFRINVGPIDGDVWIATSRGLARYSVKQDTWTYYTRADGLPSDQIQALAFDKDGTLYAGTQCDGLAIASAADGYKTWRVVRGAEQMPMLPTGEGLPSNLINDVLVASRLGGSTVCAATTCGLAWSKDKGATWRFVRGRDWAAKVKDRYAILPRGWDTTPGGILAEDYVTCLAEDENSGKLWIGYRREGCGTFDPVTMRCMPVVSGLYATAILSLPNRLTLLGTYCDGLVDLLHGKEMRFTARAPNASELPSSPQPLPSPAKPPTLAELNSMLKEFRSSSPIPEESQPTVVALDDDWRTQGDWLGRYGRYWACLAGVCSPSNYLWGAGPEKVQCFARIGPNCAKEDGLRYWIESLHTNDSRSLEMPPVYLHSRVVQGFTTWDEPRREAVWDDHGEAYPMTRDGPHIYSTLRIPQGVFYLSLYAVNTNGKVERNRYRDYRISVRPHGARKSGYDIDDFQQQPELAHARVRDFYGGVWKRFLVRGPTAITIEVNRNHSFNTNLQAVMLDLVDEDPPPYFHTVEEWTVLKADRQRALARTGSQDFQPCGSESEAVGKLAEALERAQQIDSAWWATHRGKYYTLLARSCHENPREKTSRPEDKALYARTGTILYHLNLYARWEEQQRLQGLVPARDIEKALRWDGDPSCSGKGNQFVTTYVEQTKRDTDLTRENQSAERR